MNWNRLRTSYPLAMEYFDEWVRHRNKLRKWTNWIRPGSKLIEMPPEMVWGIMIDFFRDQDILFTSELSRAGGLVVSLHRPGASGQFRRVGTTRRKMDHQRAWQEGLYKAFLSLDRRLAGNGESYQDEIVVGLETDE